MTPDPLSVYPCLPLCPFPSQCGHLAWSYQAIPASHLLLKASVPTIDKPSSCLSQMWMCTTFPSAGACSGPPALLRTRHCLLPSQFCPQLGPLSSAMAFLLPDLDLPPLLVGTLPQAGGSFVYFITHILTEQVLYKGEC